MTSSTSPRPKGARQDGHGHERQQKLVVLMDRARAREARERKVIDDDCAHKDPQAEMYAEYEENGYKRVVGLIDTIPEPPHAPQGQVGLTQMVFKAFTGDKIYKRQK
ncbi:hypothetical protein BD414DRAFT_537123 [Trametes punicea]|nr:hypothetical protein BD414DRAFT_537123 [Trametes punicea]